MGYNSLFPALRAQTAQTVPQVALRSLHREERFCAVRGLEQEAKVQGRWWKAKVMGQLSNEKTPGCT